MASTAVSSTSFELENQRTPWTALQNAAQQPSQYPGDNEVSENAEVEGRHLECVDGGLAAWRILLGAFVFEALLWGFPLSFGVFQNYYSQLPEFANDPYIIIVGSTASGISYLGAPFMAPLVKRYSKYQRHMICAGWSLCILGLLAGSFANTLGALILTQGIMYGVGFVIFYYPIISMVNEWWIARRGMAFGIITSASGASGVVMPFIVSTLLNRYGYKTTLRAITIAMVVLTGPLIPLFKSRLPSAHSSSVRRTDWSFAKRPLFWVYCASNVAQGLGFFFPSLYLPSYATSVGLSATQGALLLALMSAAQVLGQFTFGYLSDSRLSLNLLAIVSTVVAGMASLTLWVLARSFAPLVVFSIIYGFFAYGYASMRARMSTAVSEEPTAALATFSIYCFSQGLGNVLTGPISAGLLSGIFNHGTFGAMKYKAIVVFTGACMLLSALSIGSWYTKPRRL